ncbi:hypothetical protein RJ639_013202 [Escallonia herrerae]|uniref:Uncharacterized protein n=1 Tax=Escallonia herrerae TaxID=1293975 RepID=A0AA88VHL5_9ASTE|nr:hypothetical protein RJ639_013202 [Escallonia herrerae]
MVDSKTVISQVQEFQLILHDIHVEGMVLGEYFQVAALIEKLPPTWKDFKNYLKHKRKEMKLEDLIVRLRIEEDNRQSEKKAGNYHQKAKENVVEQDGAGGDEVLERRLVTGKGGNKGEAKRSCWLQWPDLDEKADAAWHVAGQNGKNSVGWFGCQIYYKEYNNSYCGIGCGRLPALLAFESYSGRLFMEALPFVTKCSEKITKSRLDADTIQKPSLPQRLPNSRRTAAPVPTNILRLFQNKHH